MRRILNWLNQRPEVPKEQPEEKTNKSSVEEIIMGLQARIKELETENARLTNFDFSPEEFQTFCHNLHGKVSAETFAAGCAEEQRKLYGCSPDKDRVDDLTQELEKAHEKLIVYERYFKALESARRLQEQIENFDK